jgi:hypothetical protein
MWGACLEGDPPAPFAPWVAALGDYARSIFSSLHELTSMDEDRLLDCIDEARARGLPSAGHPDTPSSARARPRV